MLPSVRLFVCLSVPFTDSAPLARWRYARVAPSSIFDRGQRGMLHFPRPNIIIGEHIARSAIPFIMLEMKCGLPTPLIETDSLRIG